MVTAIVRRVQAMLRDAGRPDIAVEIVFPVAADAITPASASMPAPAAGTGAIYFCLVSACVSACVPVSLPEEVAIVMKLGLHAPRFTCSLCPSFVSGYSVLKCSSSVSVSAFTVCRKVAAMLTAVVWVQAWQAWRLCPALPAGRGAPPRVAARRAPS